MERAENQTGTGMVVWQGRRIDGIVFDVDGTLSDSIEAYYEIFREVCSGFGIEVERKDVFGPMSVGSNIWDHAIPQDLPDRVEKIEQCMQAVVPVFREVMHRTEPFPGLGEVLSCLRQNGLTLGILTSSWKPALLPLEKSGLLAHFSAVVTREDGYRIKPAPDGLLACLKMMHVDPAHAITVGDSALDIRAGKEAGALTIAVLSGIGAAEQLASEAPALIIDGVSGLAAALGLQVAPGGSKPPGRFPAE